MNTSFVSIHYPFAIDMGLGRLAEETNYADHIEQLVKQVLFTAPGERINRPDFGCGIKRLVFAPNDPVTASLAQVTIFQSLKRWLGSVIEIQDVKAVAVDERLEIKIAYSLKARQERRYLNLELAL
jgi:phage baseplate assembly protein W